jgi:hypothetical protein
MFPVKSRIGNREERKRNFCQKNEGAKLGTLNSDMVSHLPY